MSSIKCINLLDRSDRLGSNLVWYISTILVAIKNNYKICLIKPISQYSYYNSIFVEALFIFIKEYNQRCFDFGNIDDKKNIVKQYEEYFKKIINSVIDIKCDFISSFKECIFTQNFKDKLNELAKTRNYVIPYNTEKTILVHLRLDDKQNTFISDKDREYFSMKFRYIIDHDDNNYIFPGYAGQSAIKEEKIIKIIEKALTIHKDYEVIIITNGKHNLPYKTISNSDESYDLFLLCNSQVLIGSMSSFSLAAMIFGNHKSIYYPLWDHAVCYGLTTKYDKNKIIEYF